MMATTREAGQRDGARVRRDLMAEGRREVICDRCGLHHLPRWSWMDHPLDTLEWLLTIEWVTGFAHGLGCGAGAGPATPSPGTLGGTAGPAAQLALL